MPYVTLLVLAVTAMLAVASTARTFSGTVDEPAHIAAGMQWLTSGRYDYDLQHPPLARLAAALGPYLHGARGVGAAGVYDEGAAILGAGRHYVDTLARARHGELVFLALLAVVAWAWGRRLGGDLVAGLAALFTLSNPTILAHAGLATTDIACAASTTLALFVAARWAARPTTRGALGVGLATGFAVSCRLSAIAFLGAAYAACYVVRGVAARRWRVNDAHGAVAQARPIALALAAAAAVVWAAYRFAVGPIAPGGLPLPAPAFLMGVRDFLLHGATGHPTFLLGTARNRGWWYYYLVALAVKTPLPLLAAAAIGVAVVWRRLRDARDWEAAVPLVAAGAVLAVALPVKVDLGVRLILPIYPLLALVAAQGVAALLEHERAWGRVAALVLVGYSLIIPVRSYPDYLSYFNPIAGPHPEHVLVDSNLDWGQDLYRLRDTLAARGIHDSVFVAYFGTGKLAAAGVPNARILKLHERRGGWIAASETYLAGEWVGGAYQWLLAYPSVARIGPSMRLWHLPSAADSASALTTDSSRR